MKDSFLGNMEGDIKCTVVPSEKKQNGNYLRPARNRGRTQTQTTSRESDARSGGQNADGRTSADQRNTKRSITAKHDHSIRSMQERIAVLENEVQETKRQLAQEEEEKREYRDKYNDLRDNLLPKKDHALQECQDANIDLQHAREADKAKISDLQRRLEQHAHQETQRKATISDLNSRNKQMASLVRKHHREIQDLQCQLKQRDQQEVQHKAAIATLESLNMQRALLIEQRHEEQQAAKEFLDSHDKLSGADVVAKVRALNEQIFQIAAFMAESCKYHKPEAATINEAQHVFDRLLLTTNHTDNPEIVQVALQGRLVLATLGIISGWGKFMDPIPRFLDDLARSVQAERLPAINRRWRSITHAHAMTLSGSTDDSVNYYTEEFMKISATILRFSCGIVDDSVEIISRNRISGLVRQALDLQKIVNQDIMSCDYVPIRVQDGTKFDLATMLDYELDEPNPKRRRMVQDRVVCTTALGVLRLGPDKNNGSKEGRATLLKPTVARDAYLVSIKEAIEEDK